VPFLPALPGDAEGDFVMIWCIGLWTSGIFAGEFGVLFGICLTAIAWFSY
jgi:hypothetical protein